MHFFRKFGAWFAPERKTWKKPRCAKRVNPLKLKGSFTRLERRQMFAVDAIFSLTGNLSIEITAAGETQANLLADGLDFFVDANNNQSYDPLETRGAIDQLNSISVNSPDAVGTLLWQGDFNRAPLASLQSVDIQSIANVQLHANFNSIGSVSIDVSNNVVLGSDANIGGSFFVQVGPTGSISDTSGAHVDVLGNASLLSQTDIILADNLATSWVIGGHIQLQTSGDVDLGSSGTFEAHELSVEATNVTIKEFNSVVLGELVINGDLDLTAGTNVEDRVGSSIQVNGNLSLRGGTITLADHARDILQVNGNSEIIGDNADVTISEAGSVRFGSLSASGANVTVYEDDAMFIQSLNATGNAQITSTASITDAAGASLAVQGNLLASGTSISLADSARDVLHVAGDAQFKATSSDVTLGSVGDTRLGGFSANGRNVTLQEDDSTLLLSIDASGELSVTSVSTISDKPNASIRVTGNATMSGTAIVLADNAGDTLSVGGSATFTATAGYITIADAGLVTLGSLSASGANVTIFEDDAMLVQSLNATGNTHIRSSATITDASGASITVLGNLIASGTLITLADSVTDILHVTGDAQFTATSGDVNLGSAGDVRLGCFSATGTNITLQEDDSTLLLSIDASGELSVTSVSTISDKPNASIRVTGNATMSGTAILLADNAGDTLSVGGSATFTATAGDITIADVGLVTLGSLSASGANVTIFEDNAMLVQSLNATGNAQLTSSATITDAAGASIMVQGNLLTSGTSITLADNSMDILHITGDAQFVATSGDVTLSLAGDLRLGCFSATGNNVTLQEDDSTLLLSIDASGELSVTSVSTISDKPNASIRVTGNATMSGTAILLADNAGDTLSVGGSATFTATAGDITIADVGLVTLGSLSASGVNVTIFEDNAMLVQSLNATGNGQITSTASITDTAGASLTVHGLVASGTSITLADSATDILHVTGYAQFIATSGDVNLGSAGDVRLGCFSATGSNITLQEDDSTQLLSIDASGDLSISSASTIDDKPNASIRVNGNATMHGTAIGLADNAGDTLSVGGSATFAATAGDITIDDAGLVTLGSLAASGANVTVFEDDAMLVQSLNATGNAQITSTASITDAAGASLTVQGNLLASGTSISLADSARDVLHVAGDAQFKATSSDVTLGSVGDTRLGGFSANGRNVTLQEDDDTQLLSIDALGDLSITSDLTIGDKPSASIQVTGNATMNGTGIVLADNAGDTLSVGGSAAFTATAGDIIIADAGLVTLGSLAASGANVTIFEDDAMLVQSLNATGNTHIRSSATITGASGASITVQGNLLASGTSITLADSATDILHVVGDAQFVATLGDVSLGTAGDVRFGCFSATGSNITLQEDDSTLLLSINASGDLSVTSVSTIGDKPNASIRVTGNATMSGTAIVLADNAGDTLSVGGSATFAATTGDITIADAGLVTLGSLAASSANVTVFEDDAMSIQSLGATGNAQVTSSASITDAAGASITVQGNFVAAGTSIALADSATDILHVIGDAQFIATSGDVNLGPAGDVRLGCFSATGSNITLQEDDSTLLFSINASGDLSITSASTIGDKPNASIRVTGNATMSGTAIVLADNAGDTLSVGGSATFAATAGDITIDDAGLVTLGSLAASGANVTVFEDDAMLVQSLNATGNARITSSATIADAAGASITVQGNLLASGTSINLADSATDVLHVVGDAQFIATSGDVTLGPAGDVRLGCFSATGSNVTLQEDDSTLLLSIDASGDLSITSVSTISDKPNATIRVNGNATMSSTAIELADKAGDTLSVVGSVAFTATSGDITIADAGLVTLGSLAASGANVTIFEDDAMLVQSLNATGNVQITSSAGIIDNSGASITVQGNLLASGTSITLADSATDFLHVTGDAQFIATSGDINLGPAGDVRLGTFSASAMHIAIQEDDSTLLGIVDAAESLSTTTSSELQTTANSHIEAIRWDAHANGSIRVATSMGSSITIEDKAFMSAGGDVVIEQPGGVNFGSIGFLAANVYLSEDSPTHLDGSVAESLVVESLRKLTQSGVDTGSGVRDLHIATDAKFDLSAAPGEVYLLRHTSSPSSPAADGSLSSNRIDGVVSISGVLGNLELRNVSTTATLGMLEGSFEDVSLWHPNASIVLLGDIRVSGDMDVIAGIESSDTSLTSRNPVDTVASPNADVQDRGNLSVQGNARFTSAGDIRLSDAVGESIRVSGTTSLVSFNAGKLVFGTDGIAHSAGLAAYSVDAQGNRGDFVASLDTSTVWETPQIALPDGRFLPSLLNNLQLQVNGDLEDSILANTQLSGGFDITASGSVKWGEHSSNTLQVVGSSLIRSLGGNVVLGSGGVVATEDIRIEAINGTITVGGFGLTQLGVVELIAKSIDLSEDESLMVRTAIADDVLRLSSSAEIVNLTPYDASNREGISARQGVFHSGSHTFLGQVSIAELSARAHANGSLPDTLLFPFNEVADRIGQRFLDVFGSNLPPGIQTNNELINGDTFTRTQQEASYLHRFEREYGVYLTNLGALQINSIVTEGDGVRVYIETYNSQNLQVVGTVSLTSTTSDVGGIVLIAGGKLDISGNGELRIQQASQPVETQRIVKDEHFSIRAFDGGTGLPGYLSTRDVLYASDAFADAGTQNVLQRLALQFGNRGEAGFENWVQYADGRIQNFDKSGQLFASQVDSRPQDTRLGSLRAFDPATSDIAVVERSIPFEDSFLATFQTLPTLAVFRRDFSFFFFENGGTNDLASSTEQSPAFDPVSDVLSPGRKVSLPLPTDIVVSRPILVPSQPWVPITDSAVAEVASEIPISPISQASFEIAIYAVGFDDTNGNGQADDSELPPRNNITFPEDTAIDKTLEEVDARPNESTRTEKAEVKHGEVIEQTRDLKGVAAATTEQLDRWVDEYQKDPLKRSGAYAIISKDSITGVEVLRVFSIRDGEEENRNEAFVPQSDSPSSSTQETATGNNAETDKPPLPPPAKPADRDDLSYSDPTCDGPSIELLASNEFLATSSVAVVIASHIKLSQPTTHSFRRRARRMRNGASS